MDLQIDKGHKVINVTVEVLVILRYAAIVHLERAVARFAFTVPILTISCHRNDLTCLFLILSR
jgi:hypothetical protein